MRPCVWNKVLGHPISILVSNFFFSPVTEVSGIHDVKLYTYKELRIATDDFSDANKIGEGGFGSVHKVPSRLIILRCVLNFFSSLWFWISPPTTILWMAGTA